MPPHHFALLKIHGLGQDGGEVDIPLVGSFFALNALAFPGLALAGPSSVYDGAVTGETQRRLAQNQVPARSAQDKAEDAAREGFDTFTREWMKKLIKTEDFQKKKKMRMTQTAEGFVAEYTGCLPHRYTVVKPTESEATPFIGMTSSQIADAQRLAREWMAKHGKK